MSILRAHPNPDLAIVFAGEAKRSRFISDIREEDPSHSLMTAFQSFGNSPAYPALRLLIARDRGRQPGLPVSFLLDGRKNGGGNELDGVPHRVDPVVSKSVLKGKETLKNVH
jgi:hypothetical protein